jgi:hypothetical protein
VGVSRDPIERLWGLMHKHVTHNRCHATFADFKAAKAQTTLWERIFLPSERKIGAGFEPTSGAV